MTKLSRALVGTAAAAAMAVSSASPALARDRDRDRDGIDVGDVIAGAVIIGGIAAVASSIGRGDDRYDNGYAYGYPYEGRWGYRGGDPRQAVEQCVRTVENVASRYSYGRADVTDIRGVDRNRRGYTVRGRIAVNSSGRGWNGGSYYGRGWNGDYRGWNSSLRGYDSGSFKCRVEYGRVVDLDVDGVRGL